MNQKSQLKETLNDLFTSQRLAVLGTHGGGQPYGNLVAFAATKDLKHLLFATSRATRKFANISADSRVSMLVDNRENQPVDFRKAMAVTATGTAREVRSREKNRFLKIYLKKHPQLKEFVMAPMCALLKIRIEEYIVAYRFQNVMKLKVKTKK